MDLLFCAFPRDADVTDLASPQQSAKSASRKPEQSAKSASRKLEQSAKSASRESEIRDPNQRIYNVTQVSLSILAAVMTAPRQPIELREFPRPDLPAGGASCSRHRCPKCAAPTFTFGTGGSPACHPDHSGPCVGGRR